MKKLILSFIFAIMLGLTFNSCSHDYNLYDPDYNKQEVLENSQKIFGISFAENHDWKTATNSQVKVNINTNDYKIAKVQILVTEDADSVVSIKLLNEANITNNESISFVFDTPKKYSNLLVAFVTDNNQYFYKRFNLGDTEVYFENPAQTRGGEIIGWQPSYPIPSITPVINGSVETYANERGWIPGEVFYTFDYETTSNVAYAEDFKTLFRTIIFNYFPNGRNYDNLPQIKKSGYYNENVYPITTGDEPIVVSPVYKNDGGYYEICYSELYYYYFKGDLTKEQIEALPKYRAIDLSTVYGNGENDNIEKKPSYVLAFFGDGTPSIGTVGSYQFEPGYKIGFIYKSNTHTDKKSNKEVEIGNVKQGELYGDGRLNYNINKWGNFKTSKLGVEDPRMAWMSVNDKMFLCVESGTDRDYNDLILEVEGGIEPIIIIPDDPEDQYYTLCYEDHRLGDYDLNDVVLKGCRLDETHVEWTLMATGANDELYIYNIEGKRINKNSEVHSIFGTTPNNFVNTSVINTPFVKDTVIVDKNFSFLDVTTQPYVYDKTQNWFVKISKQGEDPHAIMIADDFKWPKERICVKDAYLRFNEWGTNQINSTDWYKYPEIEKIVK